MKTILFSYFAALRSLGRPGVLWHLLWPTLAASVLWTSLLVFNWGWLTDQGAALIGGLPLVGGWIAGGDRGIAMIGCQCGSRAQAEQRQVASEHGRILEVSGAPAREGARRRRAYVG